METEGAVRLWSRSTDIHLRYATFVGDRDSSSYKAICELNDGRGLYDIPVIKEECINHVSKRMGTRLRKIKEASEIITTKTGKKMRRSVLGGAHMLTDQAIDCLCSYYGKAIRDNVGTDYVTMKKAIWATYFHLTSTDKAPAHQFCPHSTNSWCFYNRAKALNQKPKTHSSKNLFLSRISSDNLEYIKGIYRDLAVPELLRRCLKGKSQNLNESLHVLSPE